MKTLAILLTALALGVPGSLPAADVTGKWKSDFESRIGHLKYTYELRLDGDKLTGKAIGDSAGAKSETEIREGKVNSAEVTFLEMVKFQDQEIRVEYKGKLAGDEIKFTRKVADIAVEELVAKRLKEPNAK